jgi:hypothetical protein
MGGNSRKAAARRNVHALIKAKDILTVHERGISEIDSNVLEVCRIATTSPSLLTIGQGRMIWAVWQKLAEATKLRGIRTPNSPPASRSPEGSETDTPHPPSSSPIPTDRPTGCQPQTVHPTGVPLRSENSTGTPGFPYIRKA